ncbi:TPA: FRG domain-containing protein [Vibrio parahaemolyticus]
MKISNVSQFVEVISKYKNDSSWVFRGQAVDSWDLKPKVFREPFEQYDEEHMLDVWSRVAIKHLDKQPASRLEWLALAQHNGLPTRLLDWSYNPLVALYFCCSSHNDSDGEVFALRSRYDSIDNNLDPFKITEVDMYRASSFIERISSQQGLFTIHHDSKHCLKQDQKPFLSFDVYQVPASSKSLILDELHLLCINEYTIYQDLESLSKSMVWQITDHEDVSFKGG